MNKYPIYIISKGRAYKPLTANFFKRDGVKFKIVIEPQEFEDYKKSVGEEFIQVLPFSNLGMGSMSARNWCWEDAKKNGYKRHWVFDDNINLIRRLHKGKRIPCNALTAIEQIEEFTDRYENIGISGFNYQMFVTNTTSKPYYLNVHVYSALLIKTDMPFRWRMRYNEDVDLCLQVLNNQLCTVLFNAFMVDKVSTTAKMKGGNQTELYCNNAFDKKLLKTRSLEEIWPQYVKIVYKFGRPHHSISWTKYFKHQLIRRKDLDWNEIKNKKVIINLKAIKKIKSNNLKEFYSEYNSRDVLTKK